MLSEEQRKKYNASKLNWYYKNRERERERAREYEYQKNYSISKSDYERMFEAQNGCCKICHKPETATYKGLPRRLSVDHEHQTGRVRGLLCVKCNALIGFAQEHPQMLEGMIAYLEAHDEH